MHVKSPIIYKSIVTKSKLCLDSRLKGNCVKLVKRFRNLQRMTKPVCRKKSPSKEFFASHHNKSCSCSNRSIQFYESLFLIHCQSCGHISFILFVKYHSTYCTTTLFYFFHQIFLKNLGHFRLELSFHICLLHS